MTSKLNMMTVLRYGIIWEFVTVPDSVSTRPFIAPPSYITESSSAPAFHVSARTDIMEESELPDVKPQQSMSFQIPESTLDISGNILIPYDTVEKKGNRFFTPWGRSGADYPESIILRPGEHSTILLFRVNAFFNS